MTRLFPKKVRKEKWRRVRAHPCTSVQTFAAFVESFRGGGQSMEESENQFDVRVMMMLTQFLTEELVFLKEG